MAAVNWLLINAGNAGLWLWDVIKAFFGGVFEFLDMVLNPVLSPVFAVVNPICTWSCDGVYAVLSPLPVWLGLTVLSAVCGVFMLIAFRYTSNQTAIGRARDTMTANLLALKLYKDDIRVAFRSQRRLFAALLRWQWLMLRPIVILVVLLLPIFAQMGARYQWRPLYPDEQTTIKVCLNPEFNDPPEVLLQASAGLVEVVGPVAGDGELVWRVRGGEPGRHTLHFDTDGTVVEKELVVSENFERVSAKRPGRRWTSQILHPIESPLPADSPVQSIEILYGSVDSWIYGADWWILYFLEISMITALLCLPFFKVRF
ncbi:MAG: hypothetical protein KAY37_03805 [Phycisphaerae bacterium]|nr:hypothetical protein [Phycisphaerae bacterium]